jgi:hypothetical protein
MEYNKDLYTKEKIRELIKEIGTKLNNYFNNEETKDKLKVLDNNEGRTYYTGVTEEYIHTYVLEQKYLDPFERMIVKYCLAKANIKDYPGGYSIKRLFCGHVEDMVYESGKYPTLHWSTELVLDDGEYFFSFQGIGEKGGILSGKRTPFIPPNEKSKQSQKILLESFNFINSLLN